MYGAVDLGSNSFRLHIGRHEGDTIRVLKSLREPIRLAAGLDAAGVAPIQNRQAVWSAEETLEGRAEWPPRRR